MRSFFLVALASLFFASALSQQSPGSATALGSAAKPPLTKSVGATKSPVKKPVAPKPTPGLYLQAICTLSPDQAEHVGECWINGAVTQLPAPALSLAAITSCLEMELNPNRGPVQPATSAAAVGTQLKAQFGGAIPAPFQLVSAGESLYLYSTDESLKAAEKRELSGLITAIGAVAGANSGYVFESPIPHAVSLGNNVPASLQAIAPSGITVASAGPSRARITTDGTVSCNILQAFMKDFERFANHTHSDTPVASVFFIDPAASGSALGATAIPYPASGDTALGITLPPAVVTTSTGAGSGMGTASGSGTGTGAGSGSGMGSGSGTGGSTATTGSATPAVLPSPGSVTASNTSGNTSTNSGGQTITITTATTTGSGTSTVQPNGSTPTGPVTTTAITTTQPAVPPSLPAISAVPTVPAAPASAPTFSVNGRDLLFTGGTPGDDAWITEKKRAVALLDLPQPQVLVNAWVIQNSTSRADDSGKLTTLLHQVVNSYNDTIQLSLYMGWSKLEQLSSEQGFFDKPFYNYITLRTVADPPDLLGAAAAPTILSGAAGAQAIKTSKTDDIREALDIKRGFCPPRQYCLGYPTIFRPAQPRLTDMLLTLLAANDPGRAASEAIDAIENAPEAFMHAPPSIPCGGGGVSHCQLPDEALNEIKKYLWLGEGQNWTPCGCQQRDEQILFNRASGASGSAADQRLPLECFRIAMQLAGSHPSDPTQPNKWTPVTFDDASVPTVGVARSALADFLFNYKMSQEFPHDFAPYDLTASAQTLDSALAPYIHAFNEDLQAYQTFMRAQFVVGVNALKLTRDKNTFINDGIVTVQTTSGDVGSVSTATQSYLNVSKAPNISQLLSSITGTNPGGTSATAGSNPLTGVLSNLSFNEAQVLMGAVAAYQSTSLNVGRQLNLVVKPRSLLGAEAAEMDVQLNADQASTPQYWNPGPTGGAGSAADLSDVSQHDVTTHVRIDSIRLFDISSLTAIVSKGRDKFPLLPPFVEIPYIGTLAGIPLRAAREYHSSSAVLSAVIVPTATDIAYSLRFTYDRILQRDAGADKITANPWIVRKATSMSDFGSEPVREFHKMKLHCIATLGRSPYPLGIDENTPAQTTEPQQSCQSITFEDLFQEGAEN